MFPHPCGAVFAEAVKNGADPRTVVPDDFVIVYGGTGPIPPPGTEFSGATGPTLDAAASAVPHGTIRVTTAGAIRARGGVVEWDPDLSRYNTWNEQHVNITEGRPTALSAVQPNPVPKKQRIDGDKK